MKLGIGLPNTLAPEVDRRLFLEWARLADQAGFHVLATIDKPNYDSWDPLASLAAAASVTERARLATTILQLPNRNEVLVAKQVAVIDRVSGGRVDLGVAMGGRRDDFDVFGSSFKGKPARFEQQITGMKDLWARAREADRDHGVLGPAPAQEPHPPIWVGAMTQAGIQRAVRLGDGFIFGTAGSQMMGQMTPGIRQMAREAGRADFTVAGLAYVGIDDDPKKALDLATHAVLRYYGQLWTEPENLIHHGPGPAIAEAVAGYVEAGIDILILFPEIPDIGQVEALAEHVLPSYLGP